MFSKIHFVILGSTIALVLLASSAFCEDSISHYFMSPSPAANKNNASSASVSATPASQLTASSSAWVLRPNDIISMTVYQEDDLSNRSTIDVNGMVMLPLLGQVKIGGLTIGEATTHIQELYNKDYIVNPKVNLTVEQFAVRQFAVMGEVQHPGSFDFPLNQPLNLLQAIAISGGYTRLGAPSRVTVRRVENGSPKLYRLDAEAIADNQNEKPFEILPNDIISVGQRTF